LEKNKMEKKKLGLFACSAIVAGNMMGSGIALLPANLAAIGSVTIISWLIASLGAICLAFVFAKLGSTNPQDGGPVGYSGEVAPIFGFQAGILYFNANWIGNIAVAITGVAYLSTLYRFRCFETHAATP
jgi:cadaverine:lysine antiporter